PRNHFTFARIETVPAFGGMGLANGADRMRLDWLSPREPARTCRLLFPAKPVGSIVEKSCEPCSDQPSRPDSNPPLTTRFSPLSTRPSTLSTRHSPMPCNMRMTLSLTVVPSVSPSGPLYSMAVHRLSPVSSLSAQFEGR